MDQGRDDFFIGWAPRPEAGLRRFLRPVIAAVLLGLPLAGLLLGAAADDPAGPRFGLAPGQAALADLPSEESLRGVLLDGPSPLLHLASGRTLLLSDDGKRGPTLDLAALRGPLVAMQGYVLRRGAIEMLVLTEPPAIVPDAPPPVLPAVEPMGRWRITGEVCDGKCAGGAMQPGTGIGHRACATLCLDGDIPAVFVATGPVAGHAFLVLGDREGRAPLPAMRDLIGRRVVLEGEVERRGSLLVFRAEAP
jgi:hypothetical protein